MPFRIPDGVTLAPVNRTTGEPTYIGAPDFILEAFKPGTEPSVGGLGKTTRFGSGTDSLGGFFGAPSVTEDDQPLDDFLAEDFASNEEDENAIDAEEAGSEEAAAAPEDGHYVEDREAGDTSEDGGTPAAEDPVNENLSDILDRAEAAIKEETPSEATPETPADVTPETPQDIVPKPPEDALPKPEEPVEKALDDGIY